LQVFPHRGTRRDNIRPGLRVISFRRRTVVIFQVDEDIVSIIGIFHGGQNYEAMFEKPNVALY
jgi:plasmid stabilization system protein ParE